MTSDIPQSNLTEEQILMLEMSEQDIKEGKLISQDELDEEDKELLKRLAE